MTVGTEAPTDHRGEGRYRLGGVLLVLAAVYFVGELVAAAGWRGRPYEWTQDAISLFGVPERQGWGPGAAVSSLHAVMNVTFVGSGVRLAVAAPALAPFVPRRGRWVVLGLALVQAAGFVVVGAFPTGPVVDRSQVHGVGAGLIFFGGTLLLIALTANLWREHRRLAVSTGVCALVAVVGMVAMPTVPSLFGVTERLTVYAPLVWQVLAGAVVLASRRRGAAAR